MGSHVTTLSSLKMFQRYFLLKKSNLSNFHFCFTYIFNKNSCYQSCQFFTNSLKTLIFYVTNRRNEFFNFQRYYQVVISKTSQHQYKTSQSSASQRVFQENKIYTFNIHLISKNPPSKCQQFLTRIGKSLISQKSSAL